MVRDVYERLGTGLACQWDSTPLNVADGGDQRWCMVALDLLG